MTIRDAEVLELFADRPELLAIADAVSATQRELAKRPRPRRAVRFALVGLAAALVVPSAWAIQRALRSAGPPKTPAMVTAAHRDEARMLARFVAPPHAQRSAHVLPAFAHETQIFGITPRSTDPFTRVEYWRVHAPFADVLAFVRTHWPAGGDLSGCPRHPKPGDNCGLGLDTGPGVPPNAKIIFTFPRIKELVSSRVLRVQMLGIPHGWTSIQLIATNQTWVPYRFRNHGGEPVIPVRFSTPKGGAPVAGRTFTGIYVTNIYPQFFRIRRIACGGMLGTQPLRGMVRPVSPPAFGLPTKWACSWKIPAGSAGERLRTGLGRLYGDGVKVYVARSGDRPPMILGDRRYTWVVRK
jgi:hypothetical protein